jgi:hypothetical protein
LHSTAASQSSILRRRLTDRIDKSETDKISPRQQSFVPADAPSVLKNETLFSSLKKWNLFA